MAAIELELKIPPPAGHRGLKNQGTITHRHIDWHSIVACGKYIGWVSIDIRLAAVPAGIGFCMGLRNVEEVYPDRLLCFKGCSQEKKTGRNQQTVNFFHTKTSSTNV